MRRKNMISMITSLVLVGAVVVGGTLALLTSQTESLQNTFTVGDDYDQTEGNPDFILQENVVVQDNTGAYIKMTSKDKPNGELTAVGQGYDDLVSDTTLFKNPFFTLRNANEDGKVPPTSWVVAKIDANDVKALRSANISFNTVSDKWYVVTATSTDAGKIWTYSMNPETDKLNKDVLNNLGANTTETKKFYFIYKDALNVGQSTEPLFTELKVDTVVPSTNIDLDVTGVAVQAVKGSNLNDNLTQIMTAAAGVLQ